MLDLKLVRKDPEAIATLLQKSIMSSQSRNLLPSMRAKEADVRSQELLAERKKASKQIGALIASGKSVDEAKAEVDEILNRISDELDTAVARAKEIQQALDDLMMQTPNIPDGAVPAGRDEEDNEEVLKWGTPANLSFEPKDHADLGEASGNSTLRWPENHRQPFAVMQGS